MSDHADPWWQPTIPALAYDIEHRPEVIPTGGPERIYDKKPKPDLPRRPIGFAPITRPETEPLLWDGDNA